MSDHLSKQPSPKHEIARLNWSQPSSFKSLIPSHHDMELTPPKLVQSKYKSATLYEWNIDSMSEHQILNLLQQMTMAANAYKTQTNTSDRAIAEFLTAGFSGQLKGWCDFHLSPIEQSNILDAIQVDTDNLAILDELGNPIPDVVSALILTISLHFVGDPSHIKDKNTELLSNLKCKKLSDF